jgi:hypothetical protein
MVHMIDSSGFSIGNARDFSMLFMQKGESIHRKDARSAKEIKEFLHSYCSILNTFASFVPSLLKSFSLELIILAKAGRNEIVKAPGSGLGPKIKLNYGPI